MHINHQLWNVTCYESDKSIHYSYSDQLASNMSSLAIKGLKAVILDIEGTVCPITFVKDELFPYFLNQLPAILDKYDFPLKSAAETSDPILKILNQFPDELDFSKDSILNHINDLVARDVKDPVLKQLQGFIWEHGYTTGEILAPLYHDAIEAIKKWSSSLDLGVIIYSSGSVKAQKLLFGNVKEGSEKIDMNPLLSGYFDTINAGPKMEKHSYELIANSLKLTEDEKQNVLFLSDNVKEVEAALASGLQSYVVLRPGNAQLSDSDKAKYQLIDTFDCLF